MNHFRGTYTFSKSLLQCWGNTSAIINRKLQSSRSCRRSSEQHTKSVKELLLCQVGQRPDHTAPRVSVVGIGQVGMACTVSMLMQNVANDLVLIGRKEKLLQGEMLDLQHGSMYIRNARICSGTDYAASANSQLVVVTLGARQEKGQSRLALVQKNADIFKNVIPQLVQHSPDCVLLIVTNPVDVMTYVAWKVSGLSSTRVIGSGTMLDSSRFRYFISERLNVRPSGVRSWIIGEHGDSSVPVWSGVNVAGVRLRDLYPAIGTSDDKENWADLHKKVVRSANDVIQLKGYTSWAVGLTVSAIARSILRNIGRVHAVSISAKGFHCIDKEVFLSLPCVLGKNGVSEVLQQKLSEEEVCLLTKSADIVHEVQCSVKL